jgi:hypothetical protein
MKKLFKYSRLLHLMTFLCLCLPFFYTGCKKAEAQVEETVQIDTTSINSEIVNTARIDSIAINNQQKSIVEEESKPEEKEKTVSETLSKEYAFLQPILVSKENTFSGLAMIIDTGSHIAVFSVFIYFLLSILSLTIKYFDSKAIKTIVLLDVLALVFLIISEPIGFFNERLWGFWVAIILFSTLTILDIYILIKYPRLPEVS